MALVFAGLISGLIGYAMFAKDGVEPLVDHSMWAIPICPSHLNGVCLKERP